ncbi:MAG: glycine betaine ABC transporter substrate-binding protein [Streptomyces sp.]
MKTKQIRHSLIAGIGVLGVLSLSACSAADTSAGGGKDDKVVLAEPSWVGAQANAAVVKKLMEDELDVKVEAKQMDEPVAFDALDSGKADVILEDWHGVPKKQKKYVEEKKTVVSGGDLGVVGHIGWFVPKYYADKHPDIKNWKNLNKYAKDFKTAESGDKGHFIGAAPSYSQHDKGLIKNLKLDFKHIPSGAEAAQLKEIQRLYKAKKPFLSYWWEPQWMNEKIEMTEIELPKYTKGCEVPEGKAKCGYETNQLEKFMNKDFAKGDTDAAKFIKNFKWSTKDQNEVAGMIAGQKMKPEDAAEKWIKANKSTWEKWIPKK